MYLLGPSSDVELGFCRVEGGGEVCDSDITKDYNPIEWGIMRRYHKKMLIGC